uniref:Uncharacterized protein n=1 Tax=Micrurus spixii TaxID=129469 RepID=A0A2D4M499_9SAUR
MASLLEELKTELKKWKEEAQEGRGVFGSVFQFLEMDILDYEKQQGMLLEQEGRDKEEAIFNDYVISHGGGKERARKRVKNLRLGKTAKRKNSLRNNYNTRKKQKRGLQRRELESERQGVNGGNEKKTEEKERKTEI